MSTKPVQLNNDENGILAAAFQLATGGSIRDIQLAAEAAVQFNAFLKKLGSDGIEQLRGKMIAHATESAGDDVLPSTTPTTDTALDTSDNEKAVMITQQQGELVGIALHIASSLVHVELDDAAKGVIAFTDKAKEMGLPAQDNLRDKLQAQFNVFDPRD